MRFGRTATGPDLDSRLRALQDAVDAGHGVVDGEALAVAEALLQRAGARLGHGSDRTVVALAGATGSGKSSLFNALAGADLSTVGVRRPTTSTTSAAWWGGDATALLDWLEVDRRHHRGTDERLDGLVLLDLPDHDSTAREHRREVDRVVAVADVVVWVLDPQKYADAAVHERYLRPLAGHAGVLLVSLHQADRLDAAARDACVADLRSLLRADGLGEVTVLTTSVRAEGGVEPLRSALAERVRSQRLAVARLEADAIAAASALGRECGAAVGGASDRGVGGRARARLTASLVDAAGVPTVADAVARSHRNRAVAVTGWPVTRWVRRVRPDPLRRLHLGRGEGTGGRTSLPPASPVARARVENAVRALADGAGSDLPLRWADALRGEVETRHGGLSDRLDDAVARTDLGAARSPGWWRAVGLLQTLLLVLAVIGAVWLAGLAALAYLRIDPLEPPDLGPFPLPTVLLLGGIVTGLVVAALARFLAGIGARRRARAARARLEVAVREVADAELVRPVTALLGREAAFCAAIERAQGRR
ncbi:MAG TPA: GTPase [Acidimicrobiales bacterium]|nr:GTPase [Acidimicrobiales bacterium]